jgi:hypothetical protein
VDLVRTHSLHPGRQPESRSGCAAMSNLYRSPEVQGQWCRIWATVLAVLVLAALLASVAVTIVRTNEVTATQVALVSAAAMWLLAAVRLLPGWKK